MHVLQAYLALRDPLMQLLDEIMEMRGLEEHWQLLSLLPRPCSSA